MLRIGWVEMENFWYPVVLLLKLTVRLLMGLIEMINTGSLSMLAVWLLIGFT